MLSEKLERWRNAKTHQGQTLSEKLKRWSSGFLSGDAVGEAEEMEQCCVYGPGSTREGHRGPAWKLTKFFFCILKTRAKVGDTPMKKTMTDTVGEAREIEQCYAARTDRGTGRCQHVTCR